MISRRIVTCLGLLACLAVSAGVAMMPQVPVPDSFVDLGYSVPLDGRIQIVLPEAAPEPVEYAAERFQRAVKILTGVSAVVGGEPSSEVAVAVCLEAGNGGPQSRDGFSITFQEGNPVKVTIYGDNPRSVIYGQEALLQQIEREDDGSFVLRAANRREQARLLLRSFAQNRVTHYDEDSLDAYADARLNCIELRDGPPETMHGQFGFQAGTDIPVEDTKKVIAMARRRGMYIYGVVCCGVEDSQNEAVLDHFRTLAELGVDGLYISFDDPGTSGNAVALVKQIVALAKELGYSMDDLAFLPPAPDYGRISTDFNRKMIEEIPELADARWYFTSTPSEMYRERCQEIGLRHQRGFWFNWAMGDSPEFLRVYFFDIDYMMSPNFSDSANGIDLTEWLMHASDYIDSAMVWVRGYPEYLAQYFGVWAWNPERFDSLNARKRSYARLYGIDLVDTALLHDEMFTALKAGCTRIGRFNWIQCVWGPAGYNDPFKLKMIEQTRELAKKLAAEAPEHSIADGKSLERFYLIPMQRCLDWIQLLVETKFPEEIQPYFDRDLNWERDHGREKVYLEYWSSQIEPALKIIEERFGKMTHTKGYVEGWRAKLQYKGE